MRVCLRRREFIAGLGGAVAWPIAARAQQGDRVRRIGRNLRTEYRWIGGGGIDRIRAAVAEVVALNPDVVHTNNTAIIQELQRQTRSIPIVFANIADPVETGVVASLARPGGNATGFMNQEPALSGKWFELLKEVAPAVNRVLVLVNSGNDANLIDLRTIEAAAGSFGVQVSSETVRDAREIESAIEAIGRTPNGGLIITGGIPINDRRKLIFCVGEPLPLAGSLSGPILRRGRRPSVLRSGASRYVSTLRHLPRSHPQGRKA